MIYALVEPSIYMIASILPTTRHLLRRVHRKTRRAAQLRDAKNNGGPEHSSRSSPSADIELSGNSDPIRGDISRQMDTWQTNTNSSQEELTLGNYPMKQQVWNHARPARNKSQSTANILPRTTG